MYSLQYEIQKCCCRAEVICELWKINSFFLSPPHGRRFIFQHLLFKASFNQREQHLVNENWYQAQNRTSINGKIKCNGGGEMVLRVVLHQHQSTTINVSANMYTHRCISCVYAVRIVYKLTDFMANVYCTLQNYQIARWLAQKLCKCAQKHNRHWRWNPMEVNHDKRDEWERERGPKDAIYFLRLHLPMCCFSLF